MPTTQQWAIITHLATILAYSAFVILVIVQATKAVPAVSTKFPDELINVHSFDQRDAPSGPAVQKGIAQAAADFYAGLMEIANIFRHNPLN